MIGDFWRRSGRDGLEVSCRQCAPPSATFSESLATATAKAPRIHLSLKQSGEHGDRHTACVNTAPRLTRTFRLLDPHDPGKVKPLKQLVKSTVTLTSFVHQPGEAEGMRTSETCSVSSFLFRGSCPGGEPRRRKSQQGRDAQVSANCPLFRILAQSPL